MLISPSDNQRQTREIKFSRIGRGMIIGEVDALKQRDYVYTVKSATPNAQVYIIKFEDFLYHVNNNDRNGAFAKHCSRA
jgi:CRP-like cAMP-binding protein